MSELLPESLPYTTPLVASKSWICNRSFHWLKLVWVTAREFATYHTFSCVELWICNPSFHWLKHVWVIPLVETCLSKGGKAAIYHTFSCVESWICNPALNWLKHVWVTAREFAIYHTFSCAELWICNPSLNWLKHVCVIPLFETCLCYCKRVCHIPYL